MTRPIWFKAKRYGYGWYPATWQGWLIMLVWVVLITITAFQIDANSHSVSDTLIGIVPLWLFYTVILIVICVLTGEKARWRWGD
jgi:uncharacterized membrane protein YhaH (DUF805 family)